MRLQNFRRIRLYTSHMPKHDIYLIWLNCLQILILIGGMLITLISSMISSVIIPRCHKNFYANSFFPTTTKFWNSLPGEYFPLTYDLNGFKSKIYWHLYLWALSAFIEAFHLCPEAFVQRYSVKKVFFKIV